MLEVYVKDIDTEKHKISLGYKNEKDNPWEILKNEYPVGTVTKVKIVSITTFGAFADVYKRQALIGIGVFVDFEYDDHIENGRYTYVPEDENNGNEYIEFNMKDNDEPDSELTYYNSIEKAILNSPLKEEHEELSAPKDFLNHVDETLHIWQGKNYDTIFYRAGNDNDDIQGLVMARCKKQVPVSYTHLLVIFLYHTDK